MKASALIAAAKRDAPRRDLESEVLGALGVASVAMAPSLGAKLWTALKHAAVSKIGVSAIAIVAASGGYVAGRLQERAARHEAVAEPVMTVAVAPMPTPTPTPTLTLTQTPTPTPSATHTHALPRANPKPPAVDLDHRK